jgi:hypothetical protein
MKIIIFELVCRTCFCTDGCQWNMSDLSDGKDFYQNGKLKSAYEFSNLIRTSLIKNRNNCKFCGSENLQIYPISYDNTEIKRDIKLDYFVIDLNKNGIDKELELLVDGNKLQDKQFMKAAIIFIKTKLLQMERFDFEPKQKGESLLSITLDKQGRFKIEKFTFMGLSKEEILYSIERIEHKYIT